MIAYLSDPHAGQIQSSRPIARTLGPLLGSRTRALRPTVRCADSAPSGAPTDRGGPGTILELFSDDAFLTYSNGALAPTAAADRFDEMVQRCNELPFAKQPIVERSTGIIVGYSGVDWFDFGGHRRLELGYRLMSEARGKCYATEASAAILSLAARTYRGKLFTITHPGNEASANVARMLGLTLWKQASVEGQVRDHSRRWVGEIAERQHGQCCDLCHSLPSTGSPTPG